MEVVTKYVAYTGSNKSLKTCATFFCWMMTILDLVGTKRAQLGGGWMTVTKYYSLQQLLFLTLAVISSKRAQL